MKQQIEDKLSNGEICSECSNVYHCAELNNECEAIKILKQITDYPSFERSKIFQDKQTEK